MKLRALAAVLLFAGGPAVADGPPATVKTLVEACGAMDDDLARAVGSDVALVDVNAISRNGDGTYRITTQSYTVGGGIYTLCPDSRFYGQQMVSGLPFRSAVQVGPDLVLTAWHNPTFATPELWAIFGLRYRLVNGQCVPPDFEHLPAADVYSVTEVAADGLDPSVGLGKDFLLLRLDRDAGATYPRVRRSGQARADADHHDRVTMIAHPDRLAAKMDLAGRVVGYTNGYTGPDVESLHPLSWSSGGMVYNRDARFVETVARSPLSGWYTQAPQGCYRVADTGGHGATNDSLADFAQRIPAFELLVTPLSAVVHDGVLGGPISNPVVTRTIEAPLSTKGPIAYRITLPATTAGAPELLVTVAGPLEGSLAPGTGLDVEEIVNVGGVACGEYALAYSVTDLTHGFTDTIRHAIRIACR